MAAGAAATIRANQRASRVARVGKPRTVRARTDRVSLRLRGDLLGGFDRTEARSGLGGGQNLSGFLRGERS